MSATAGAFGTGTRTGRRSPIRSFRIGSDRHTRETETHGLTTVLREHVTCGTCGPGELTFDCPAKGGTELDPELVVPGHRLSGTEITAKDFRTGHATVLAAVAPALTRLGEHGDFGRPAIQGAVEVAVLTLLGG